MSMLFLNPIADVSAETYTVPCSANGLISTIHTANDTPGTHTLNLSNGCTYTLITVDNTDPAGDNGLPKITNHININGNSAVIERQAGTSDFRFFQIEGSGSLAIHQLTLRNGRNAIDGKIDGGAIFNNGATVSITGCTLTGNYAGCGGAIYSPSGALTITGSTFSDNTGFS